MVDGSEQRPRSKVGRLIDRYDLDGLGEDLETRWTADSEQRHSLRELADYFNQRLLQAKLHGNGTVAADSEVERHYERLTADESPRDRTRKRRELERLGLDIDELESEFVTHQAVHSYLTRVRKATYETNANVDDGIETIRRLEGRAAAVTESTICQFLDDEEYDVFVDVRALCQQCGRQYSATDLLEAGGCQCREE